MPTAKITSKGQLTVPAEVRKALGVGVGDYLAFEVKAGYAIVRRPKSLREVSEAAREILGSHGPARYPSDDEAILSAFDNTRDEELAAELIEIRVAPQDIG